MAHINQVAHRRSTQRGADAYVPVAVRVGARQAWIGDRIGLGYVHGWPIFDYGYGDPCFRATLDRIAPELFAMTRRNLGMSVALSAVSLDEPGVDRWLDAGLDAPPLVAEALGAGTAGGLSAALRIITERLGVPAPTRASDPVDQKRRMAHPNDARLDDR